MTLTLKRTLKVGDALTPELLLLAGIFADAIDAARAGDRDAVTWLRRCGHDYVLALFSECTEDADALLDAVLVNAGV